MGSRIVITEADFSLVAIDDSGINLDTIAFDGKSYRQIFETYNEFPITPGFEDGTRGSLITPSGVNPPEITSEVADSGIYSLKAFGSVSKQWRVNKSYYANNTILVACRVKCTRRTAGKLGIILGSNPVAIQTTNSAFETKAGSLTGNSGGAGLFIGSASSANLDGYIDTPVAVLTSRFTTVPTVAQWTELYNTYVELKRA